jgi:hypothetical protein
MEGRWPAEVEFSGFLPFGDELRRHCGAIDTMTQTYLYDTAASTGVVTLRSSQSGIGFNAGIDGAYLYTRHVAAGLRFRF